MLSESGYPVGPIDGKFGPRTERALTSFLNDHKVPQPLNKALVNTMKQLSSPTIGPQGPLPAKDAIASAKKADDAGKKASEKFGDARPSCVKKCPKPPTCPEPGELGGLSAKYESGSRGSAAIGYDNTGGWSYGKYQIETKRGTMKGFLKFASKESPALSKSLESAGGYDAALSGEGPFKAAWRKAAGDPAFGKLQHDYIAQKNYTPLVNKLKSDVGLDVSQRSAALRDVVWSVGVQHGPGSSVISTALKGKDVGRMTDEQIIDAIYDERSKEILNKKGENVLKYFSKSTKDIQNGVKRRFAQERHCAKKMLESEKSVRK